MDVFRHRMKRSVCTYDETVGEMPGSAARLRGNRFKVLQEVWKSVAILSMYLVYVVWNESEIENREGVDGVAAMAV